MAYARYPLTLFPAPPGADVSSAFQRWFHEEVFGDDAVTDEQGIEVGYDSNGSAEVEIPITEGRLADRHLGARATEIMAEVTGLTVHDERAGRVYDGHLPEYASAQEPVTERTGRSWWKRLLGLR